MKTPAKNNALSFVGQIKTAYKAVLKAEGEALKYAILCGEALNRQTLAYAHLLLRQSSDH